LLLSCRRAVVKNELRKKIIGRNEAANLYKEADLQASSTKIRKRLKEREARGRCCCF
jgi:hypothetical protein